MAAGEITEAAHIVAYIAPLRDSRGWLDELQRIRERLSEFPGERIVIVGRGPDCEDPEEVSRHFTEADSVQFRTVKHELKHFRHQLQAVLEALPGDAEVEAEQAPTEPPLFPTSPRIPGVVRVGIISPVWCTGGVEQQVFAMVRHTGPAVQWSGMAVLDGGDTDDATCRQMRALMPIYGSRQQAPSSRNSDLIERLSTGQAAAERVMRDSDVLIAWGVTKLAEVAARFTGPKIVVSHGCCDWTIGVLRQASAAATHFVAVSSLAVEPFPEAIRPQVRVIPNGVDLARLVPRRTRADVRRELGIEPGQLAVGYVGRFSEEKNPLAAAQAVSRIPEAVAVYVGIGFIDIRPEVERLTGGRCRFVAPPEHIGDYFAALDCVVLASPREGFGLVFAEAWASGVPLVATPTGIIPEAETEHGPLCVRVPKGATPGKLVEAVRRAVSPQNRPVVERAVIVAREHFSAEAMACNWEQFFLEIAG